MPHFYFIIMATETVKQDPIQKNQEQKQEEKKEPVKYKFGANELDLDTYIYNISNNVQSYIDYKVKHDKWNEGQINEFTNAYNNYMTGLKDQRDSGIERFSTDDLGSIIDISGQLSDIDNDGIDDNGSEYFYNEKGESITSQDYDKLKNRKKKKYKTFSANREVASFFNKVGKSTKKFADKKKDIEKFDLSKHGFISYWQHLNNPSGDAPDLKPYLDLDPYDETTQKRVVNKRAIYLADQINNYLDQLGDYNYEETSFKDRDTYIARLRNAANKLNNGVWNNEDLIALNQAGISGGFQNAFFSTEENPYLSDTDKARLEKEAKEKKEIEKKEAEKKSNREFAKSWLDLYDNNNYKYSELNPYNIGTLASASYINDKGEQKNIYNNDGTFNAENFGNYFENKPNAINEFTNNYLTSDLQDRNKGLIAWAALINNGGARPIEGNDQLAGYYYVPQITDKTTGSVLIYNPTTGDTYKTFIGNIPNLWNNIYNQWREQQGYIDRVDKYIKYKDGGIIPKKQLGGGIDLDYNFNAQRNQRLIDEGKANQWNTSWHSGRTKEQEEAGRRKVFGDPTIESPNNGFETYDMLRISSSITDIASMLASFGVGVGTAASAGLGVASTVQTAIADIAEDGLDWGDAKNFATNLGLDLIGVIPGGGAASKGAKIVKNLKDIVPKALAILGTAHAVANSGAIMDSFNKILTNPTELSVDDWRNISTGLGVITGGVGGGKRLYDAKKKAAKTKMEDNVAVEMVNEKGEKKVVMFGGKDAVDIKQGLKNKSLSEIEAATTGRFERYKGWKVATDETKGFRGFKNEEGKMQLPFGKKQGTIHVYDNLHQDQHGIYADRGTWATDVYLTGSKANAQMKERVSGEKLKGYKHATTVEEADAMIKTRQEQLDARLKDVATTSDAYVKGKPKINERLETLKKQRTDLEASLKDSPAARARWQYLRRKNSPITDDEYKAHKNKVADLESKVEAHKTRMAELDNKKNEMTTEEGKEWTILNRERVQLEAAKKRQTELDEIMSLQQKDKATLDPVNNNIRKTELLSKQLENKTFRSRKRKEFEAEFVQGKGKDAVISIRPSRFRDPITQSVEETLKKYNIIYKQGGAVNLQNVRKYAKGSSLTHTAFSTSNNYKEPKDEIFSEEYPSTNNIKIPILLSHALPRKMYFDHINNKLGNLKLSSNRIPKQRYFTSDLPTISGDDAALVAAKETVAKYNNIGNRTVTSDASLQSAVQLDHLIHAQEALTQGKAKYNAALMDSKEHYRQENNQLNEKNHQVDSINDLNAAKQQDNATSIKTATLSSNATNNKTFLEQQELEARQKENETKAKEQQFVLQDIQHEVTYNLGNYTDLTPDEEKAWNLVVSGQKVPTELEDDPVLGPAYRSAFKKARIAERNEQKRYFKIPNNQWNIIRQMVAQQSDNWVPKVKNGAKLTAAEAKNKREDIKTFLKQFKDSNKAHQKTLDRISKSLYTYVKSMIVE